jgi:probable HAF family extracellular repeat protein
VEAPAYAKTGKETTMKRLFLLGAFALASLPLTAQTKYVITDLGTLGGTSSSAVDINNHGQVTGSSATASGQTHAFRTGANRTIQPATDDLGTLGGTSSSGEDINDAGQVAGSSSNGANTRAFRSSANLQPIALTDLGTFDGTANSFGTGINTYGQVAGEAHVAGTSACFFVFSNSAFRTTATSTVSAGDNLGTLVPNNCRSAQGWAINDSGVVVGESATNLTTGTPNHAFRSAPSAAMVDLHPAGLYDSSTAVGINSAGEVVGTVTVGPAFAPTAQHCYRTVPGQPIQLPANSLGSLGGPGPFCSALDINSNSDVVGSSYTGTAIHAFLYTGGTMYDLNNLIAPTTVVLTQANGINNLGQIVASGKIDPSTFHGFRLDPVDVAVQIFIDELSDPALQLTSGQINSLTDKLTNALASIQQGAYKQSVNQLNAFISSVQTLQKTGKISNATATTLIAAANAIIAVLQA